MASRNMKKLKRRLLRGQNGVGINLLEKHHPRNFVKLKRPDLWKDPENKYSMAHCEIPRVSWKV